MTLGNFISSFVILLNKSHCVHSITHNGLLEWKTGETTYDPRDLIAQYDPVTYTDYIEQNKLLDTAGWKGFGCIANSDTKIECMVNQATLPT
jgi:hypothetical protein